MAWVAGDGFDLYNGTGANTGLQSKWTYGGAGASMVTGRFGGQGLQLVPGASSVWATRGLTASRSAGTNGFAINFPTMPSGSTFTFAHIALMQGSTYQFSVRVNSSGGLEVYRLSATFTGTLLGSSANGVIVVNTWQYLEIVWTCNSSTGAVQLLVDGTSVLNLTGLNNQNAGSSGCDTIRVNADFGTCGTIQVDDYNEGDAATALGPLRNETLRATADSSIQFTPKSVGSNFSQVNETTSDGDTSYVQASAVGNKDLYTFGSLSSSPTTIAGVTAVSFSEKTDATARTLEHSVTSGATVSDGAAFTLASSYGKFERPLATDPATSAAWLPAAVNALKAGPKLAA